jgi:hypothetical protein
MMRTGVWVGLLLSSCRCGEPSQPETVNFVAPHYGEWNLLVRQVALGEVGTAAQVARDLTAGAPGEWDGVGGEDGARAVGGALGFLQIAASAEELAEGLPIAASGCATCHAGARVQPTGDRPAWAHETAAAWASWGVVFSMRERPPSGGASEIAAAAAAWDPASKSALADLLSRCQDCHATETPGSQ